VTYFTTTFYVIKRWQLAGKLSFPGAFNACCAAARKVFNKLRWSREICCCTTRICSVSLSIRARFYFYSAETFSGSSLHRCASVHLLVKQLWIIIRERQAEGCLHTSLVIEDLVYKAKDMKIFQGKDQGQYFLQHVCCTARTISVCSFITFRFVSRQMKIRSGGFQRLVGRSFQFRKR